MVRFYIHVMLLLSTLVSCAKKIDLNEKVLNLVIGAEVKGMDPIGASDRYSSNEVSRVYEGLLEYDYLKRPYHLVPNLASEMPKVSKDGLTYTFKIREGVLFHDSVAFPGGVGRELLASDFVYSIKRLADPKLQGLGWWMLDGKLVGLNEWRDKNGVLETTDYSEEVEGLRALDKYTLEFKLTKEFPQFLYALAMPFTFVVAHEVVEHYGPEFINFPVGTGPFVLPRFDQTKRVVYSKNLKFREKYYPSEASPEFQKLGYLEDAGKKLPLVDKIVVQIMTESQPQWLNFHKGNIDYIAIPKDNFDSAIGPAGLTDSLKEKGIDLLIDPSLDVTYVAFNHDLALFKDVRIRRAMALAYDVVKSNELFYNNTAMPAQSVIPPGVAGNIKSYLAPYRKRNIEEAKKLLKEAGFPGGQGLPIIDYDCPASSVSRQMGEFFKTQMEQIGINIRVNMSPWPEFQNKINKRQIMLYAIAWGADYPDAENFLQLLYGPNKAPSSNGSGYDNPEFNKLYETASKMQDSPERTKIYEKMNRIVAEEVPWIFGVHRQTYVLKHGWLKNYVATDFEAGQAQYLNIDLDKKKELIKKM